MEFAEKEDYDKLEPSSYTGDIEAFFKAQAPSEAIEDKITEDPFRNTWGLDAQNIFATEDDDDDDSRKIEEIDFVQIEKHVSYNNNILLLLLLLLEIMTMTINIRSQKYHHRKKNHTILSNPPHHSPRT
ncbi:hypothetical protein SMMN14_05461 [Sphaerulina musiva]